MTNYEDGTYSGVCWRCKEVTEFQGVVTYSDEGHVMASGLCPTCGTEISIVVRL